MEGGRERNREEVAFRQLIKKERMEREVEGSGMKLRKKELIG